MAVALTEKAATEVKRIIDGQKSEDQLVLRFGLAGGGCSGFEYNFGLDKVENVDEKNDTKYDCFGVTVVVDRKSELYLDGTTIDFYEGLEKRGFTFANPNAQKSCGCGNSFSV
jgi:iron-sulfur cluster assembly protein